MNETRELNHTQGKASSITEKSTASRDKSRCLPCHEQGEWWACRSPLWVTGVTLALLREEDAAPVRKLACRNNAKYNVLYESHICLSDAFKLCSKEEIFKWAQTLHRMLSIDKEYNWYKTLLTEMLDGRNVQGPKDSLWIHRTSMWHAVEQFEWNKFYVLLFFVCVCVCVCFAKCVCIILCNVSLWS
jgi:hypothetical protein